MDEQDDFDVLSAIWILASRDKNNLITFEGVKYRLDLKNDYDIAAIIKRRGDLFRRGAPNAEILAWQEEMKKGPILPTYILNIKDSEKRLHAINAINKNNVFRSQFRADKASPVTDLEIVKWGLDHIEHLRTAKSDRNEKRYNRWKDIILIGVAFISLMLSSFLSYKSLQAQISNTQLQVTFLPKQKAYTELLDKMNVCLGVLPFGDQGDKTTIGVKEHDMDSAFLNVRAFLDQNEADQLEKKRTEYHAFLDGETSKQQKGKGNYIYETAFGVGSAQIKEMRVFLDHALFDIK